MPVDSNVLVALLITLYLTKFPNTHTFSKRSQSISLCPCSHVIIANCSIHSTTCKTEHNQFAQVTKSLEARRNKFRQIDVLTLIIMLLNRHICTARIQRQGSLYYFFWEILWMQGNEQAAREYTWVLVRKCQMEDYAVAEARNEVEVMSCSFLHVGGVSKVS